MSLIDRPVIYLIIVSIIIFNIISQTYFIYFYLVSLDLLIFGLIRLKKLFRRCTYMSKFVMKLVEKGFELKFDLLKLI